MKKIIFYFCFLLLFSSFDESNSNTNVDSEQNKKINKVTLTCGTTKDKSTVEEKEQTIVEKKNSKEWLVYVSFKDKGNYYEYKKASEFIFNYFKDKGFKVELLTNFIDDPKVSVEKKHLKEIKEKLKDDSKILLTGEFLYDCKISSGFYYCSTGLIIKAFSLDDERQILYSITDDTLSNQLERKTKASDVKEEKAIYTSFTNKLIPIIEKELDINIKRYKKEFNIVE